MFGKVAVLYGGTSEEREISLRSGNAVLDALHRKGVSASAIDTKDPYVERLLNEKFDRAFIALHGKGGEDGTIQGLLEQLNIPYTGTKVLGSALAMDKVKSKRIWQNAGLATPPFVTWHEKLNLEAWVNMTGMPLVAKPSSEGSSVGVHKITKFNQLASTCRKIAKYGEIMIEPWIIGDEYSVAILNDMVLPPVLISVGPDDEFYDFNSKYNSNTTNYICPVGLDNDVLANLEETALRAFKSLGASGWGRLDFIRDLNGTFWLLELNTVPGLTEHSLVPKCAAASGLEYDDLILEILATSMVNVNNSIAGSMSYASLDENKFE